MITLVFWLQAAFAPLSGTVHCRIQGGGKGARAPPPPNTHMTQITTQSETHTHLSDTNKRFVIVSLSLLSVNELHSSYHNFTMCSEA